MNLNLWQQVNLLRKNKNYSKQTNSLASYNMVNLLTHINSILNQLIVFALKILIVVRNLGKTYQKYLVFNNN